MELQFKSCTKAELTCHVMAFPQVFFNRTLLALPFQEEHRKKENGMSITARHC